MKVRKNLMNDDQRDQLEREKAMGEEKKRIFEAHIEPFIAAKKVELFGAFTTVSVTDTDTMKEIRLQIAALDGLKDSFMQFIDTGKLASFALDKEGE